MKKFTFSLLILIIGFITNLNAQTPLLPYGQDTQNLGPPSISTPRITAKLPPPIGLPLISTTPHGEQSKVQSPLQEPFPTPLLNGKICILHIGFADSLN